MPADLPLLSCLAIVSIVMWLGLLLLPWRPWSTREQISRSDQISTTGLSDVTVLIPARDEASCIAQTLTALHLQGSFAQIVLIDDQSEDGTKLVGESIAQELGIHELTIVDGIDPPAGWSGKLWALNQGLERVSSTYVMLLDADIALAEGMAPTLLDKLKKEGLDSVSVMASLFMGSWAEKLLLPPFIYYFKIIYPFRLVNREGSKMAAAAGGCVLMKTDKLRDIGGFSALSGAIIDDCTLAKKVKDKGGRIWLGLSRDVKAVRPYGSLKNIWNMVARTAFTQLHYSVAWLLLCTLLMVIGYLAPVVALLAGDTHTQLLGALALVLISWSFLPTIRFYNLPLGWVITLPLAAGLFLAMTWTSAYRYFRGERSRWKNRSYARDPGH